MINWLNYLRSCILDKAGPHNPERKAGLNFEPFQLDLHNSKPFDAFHFLVGYHTKLSIFLLWLSHIKLLTLYLLLLSHTQINSWHYISLLLLSHTKHLSLSLLLLSHLKLLSLLRVGHWILLPSERIVLLKNATFFYVLFSSFWWLMRPKRMMRSFAFFS